ncbi:hypothetical protein AB0M02_22295 [Actinoplanes sp. NPDC051861]|uniref:hypothetical protein n=1 Tax=Actinoplanes sp. NPDC051861 TaxID=3155170 RepID=UPI00343A6161
MHYLRRVYALANQGKPVTPVADHAERDRDNDVVEDEALMFESHLLCHSDCDGFYVPVAFDFPVFVSGTDDFGGGMIGSSQGLLAELRRCAPAIGIRLEPDGELSDEEAERIGGLEDDAPFHIESVVWLTLHEACRESIAGGHAIAFQ